MSVAVITIRGAGRNLAPRLDRPVRTGGACSTDVAKSQAQGGHQTGGPQSLLPSPCWHSASPAPPSQGGSKANLVILPLLLWHIPPNLPPALPCPPQQRNRSSGPQHPTHTSRLRRPPALSGSSLLPPPNPWHSQKLPEHTVQPLSPHKASESAGALLKHHWLPLHGLGRGRITGVLKKLSRPCNLQVQTRIRTAGWRGVAATFPAAGRPRGPCLPHSL